jgi:hypothetical protein
MLQPLKAGKKQSSSDLFECQCLSTEADCLKAQRPIIFVRTSFGVALDIHELSTGRLVLKEELS